ncbi:hypothetical protein FALBO_4523 [Fusarium albosuccineum]|uniref:F-box domain-containing protein n=1 Tax=Fusarium albosuccineum TaxID=1237068 RepID=A0A8H4PGA0_9HYPO|nr:hypothetical protein FALBO_4523 [Fusarium albosuccineum]
MAVDCHFNQNLIQHLVRPEQSEFKGMIPLDLAQTRPDSSSSSSSSTSTMFRPRASSLGQLDHLPAELLLSVLDLLDFQSLSRLSRVSVMGKDVVEDLPVYRDVMEHAPEALAALGQTRLLSCHPAALLQHTLRQSKCVSCFSFGGFLFLPTCERICFECLYENQALRMTTPSKAKQCFGLTESDLKQIPVMQSIPGTFGLRFQFAHKRVERLVSVKQAKQLALQVHGSAEKLAELRLAFRADNMAPRDVGMFRHFHEAPLEPPGCDMSRLPRKAEVVEDDFGGMASIRFPYLAETGVENGYLCQGCLVTYGHYMQGELPESALSELVPAGVGPYRPLLAILTRLWSTTGFPEHVRHCYGVRRLVGQCLT